MSLPAPNKAAVLQWPDCGIHAKQVMAVLEVIRRSAR